ncbi:hypothetical protein HCC30_04685 [Streptomyces sp. HNM0574]|nr:hypothetical protein [Streptomyces sp. HNM0574]
MSLAQPGITADVLGSNRGKPVISVEGTSGERSDPADGGLLMTTIAATPPEATVRLPDVVRGWFRTDRAVMPRDAVYPVGGSTEEIKKHNADEMKQSQDDAVRAAQRALHTSDLDVSLRLADVGGPSAGLLFTLGIISKAGGEDLTGGETVAGTGTIAEDGKVGPVGGVPLKTKAAKRDGATAFLVPRAECSDAQSNLPDGLRLIPVKTLDGALDALRELKKDGDVPSC